MMRIDFLAWFGRLVAFVFLIGALSLVAAVAVLIRQAEGVPPMPIALGMVGMAALVLLAAAASALVSIAHSARRGAAALERMQTPPRAVKPVFGPGIADAQPEHEEARAPVAASRSNRPTIVAQR